MFEFFWFVRGVNEYDRENCKENTDTPFGIKSKTVGSIITLWLIYFGILYVMFDRIPRRLKMNLVEAYDIIFVLAIILFVLNVIISVVLWLLSKKKVKEAEEIARIHKQHAIERAQKQMQINQKMDELRATVDPRTEYWEKKREEMGEIPLDDMPKFN